MKHVLAALLLSAVSAAQSGPTIRIRLAPDADRSGPPAWTWVREHLLRRHPAWPAGLDPMSGLRLELDSSGELRGVPDPDPIGADYLRSVLTIEADVVARGACDRSGTERWQVTAEGLRSVGKPFELLARLAPVLAAEPITVDVAALVGNLMSGATPGDPLGELLTVGALECGLLEAVATPADGDETSWRVIAHSDGGLLLPLVMAAVADADHAPSPGSSAGASAPTDLERWLLLAASTEGDTQREALRQLSRFDDSRALRILEAFRTVEDERAMIASHALGRVERKPPSSQGALSGGASSRPPRPDRPSGIWIALGLLAGIGLTLAAGPTARRYLASHGETG